MAGCRGSCRAQNLRDIIFNLRKLLGDYLIITRQTIALNQRKRCWVDVCRLSELLSPQSDQYDNLQLEEAIALYRGDLLEGFYIRGSELFEEWLTVEREQLRRLVTFAMHRLVAYFLESHAWEEGLRLTQRLLAMEPWDEAAHRQQMRLLLESGQRSAALTQYERCHQILADEFGVEPTPETQALFQSICAGDRSVNGAAKFTLLKAAPSVFLPSAVSANRAGSVSAPTRYQ
ncbi:MAG: bacterial transcriptional activator domain-containing protein [Caldilineaceae bacterium]